MRVRFVTKLLGLALLTPVLLWADDKMMETDWLHLIEGYKGETVGAQMRKVETDETTGVRKLTISIPKEAIKDRSQMEEVVVVGQAPEERKPFFDLEYETEWVDDYDNDNYGLVIRLGEGDSWPIRLYMHSDDGPREFPDITKP